MVPNTNGPQHKWSARLDWIKKPKTTKNFNSNILNDSSLSPHGSVQWVRKEIITYDSGSTFIIPFTTPYLYAEREGEEEEEK